ARLSPAERRSAVQGALATFHEACRLEPRCAVAWLNLAWVCRLAGARDTEMGCLEQALAADSTEHGGLLLGRVDDPLYTQWRRDMALGRHRIEHLRADAATRLAAACLEQGRSRDARNAADRAIQWAPDAAAAYRIAGCASERLGEIDAAREYLERGLRLTAFNAAHRMDLIRVTQAAGQAGEARRLAAASARIFDACPHERHTAEAFRHLAADSTGS
ncbi:MAG: hypothetical protein JXR94_08945, partial [Candidatus Hydrogenedentes bacterium]|nr:hypothetical protein [Candidatus Hydrogenedentota bacterium]